MCDCTASSTSIGKVPDKNFSTADAPSECPSSNLGQGPTKMLESDKSESAIHADCTLCED